MRAIDGRCDFPIAKAAAIAVGLMFGAGSVPGWAQDDAPLSAIDWLSQSVTTPASASAAGGQIDEPPVADGGALPEPVATSALDGPSPDSVGLITSAVSGLPRDLWGVGLTREVSERLTAEQVETLPALRQLFLTLLLPKWKRRSTPPERAICCACASTSCLRLARWNRRRP
jgi:hypothetical protein